jgi:hypothetical protein
MIHIITATLGIYQYFLIFILCWLFRLALYVLLSKIYLWHSCMFMCCINSYVYPYHTFYVRLYKLLYVCTVSCIYAYHMCAISCYVCKVFILLCILTSACTCLRNTCVSSRLPIWLASSFTAQGGCSMVHKQMQHLALSSTYLSVYMHPSDNSWRWYSMNADNRIWDSTTGYNWQH